ncbi:translation termination factor GTPase eRF3 [Tulasnella sp. 330]|nr:translation termination factor GTPase eRF3 [Tulasnella sp. 330]KAG8890009.1 translation termination factor GTPase eRF3 [Tulasnella sp. 332]
MSGQDQRLNPGASSWTPGQAFVPRSQQQSGGQQPPPGSQGMPYGQPQGQPGYGYYGAPPQQGYGGPVGGYPYGGPPGGAGGYSGGGGAYPQYGGGQYGGGYQQPPPGGAFSRGPPQGGAYIPPQQRFQQAQQNAPIGSYGIPPPSAANIPPPTGQTIKLNIGGAGAVTPPNAPAGDGKTIKLNIGGGGSGASTPPTTAKAPAAQTIKLNIGGGSSGTRSGAATPPTAQALASVPENTPAPAAKAAPSKPSTTISKKEINFTADKAKTDADKIAEDVARLADEETLKDLYGEKEREEDANAKQHLNIVFVGHVDAGKSTMGGQILLLTDMVDKRTMEKYEREAKEAGRESWYLSWALDSTAQERAKGKTVEVGRGFFETKARRYTILDAPGHKTFVPSMISGAAQADVAMLVISARKGEFETGFEKGGQTREHIMLVKTVGVQRLVVVINKMDDSTVEWSKERYDEIKDKLTPFVRGAGFNLKTDVNFIPVSAYTGVNMKDRADKKYMPWYDGPSLLELLDTLPMVDRKTTGPVMMPISEKYKDMGTVVVGKIESGRLRKGDQLTMMPNKVSVEVTGITDETEEEVPVALCGDNVRVRLRGIDDEDISPGFVLTSPGKPVRAVRQFEAQLAILDHKNIICAGYGAVMHVHTASEEVQLLELLHYFDKKTGRKSKKPPQFAKKGQKIIALIEAAGLVCVEKFNDYPQLGRFTLRDEGKTIAIGKITKLIEQSDVADGLAAMSLTPGDTQAAAAAAATAAA